MKRDLHDKLCRLTPRAALLLIGLVAFPAQAGPNDQPIASRRPSLGVRLLHKLTGYQREQISGGQKETFKLFGHKIIKRQVTDALGGETLTKILGRDGFSRVTLESSQTNDATNKARQRSLTIKGKRHEYTAKVVQVAQVNGPTTITIAEIGRQRSGQTARGFSATLKRSWGLDRVNLTPKQQPAGLIKVLSATLARWEQPAMPAHAPMDTPRPARQETILLDSALTLHKPTTPAAPAP